MWTWIAILFPIDVIAMTVALLVGYRYGYRVGRNDRQRDHDWAQRVASGRTDWDQWGNPPADVRAADLDYHGSRFFDADEEQQ